MYRLRFIVVFLAVSLFSWAGAQTLPELPENTYVGFRVVPNASIKAPFEMEDYREHPLFSLLGKAGRRFWGVDPIEFMGGTFDGTIVGGFLLNGSEPGFPAYMKYTENTAKWYVLVNELSSLKADLQERLVEKGSFPEDLDKYLITERYYNMSLEPGVTYEYRQLDGGQDYELKLKFSQDCVLQGLGQAPILTSKTFENEVPSVTPPALDFVAGVGVTDSSRLERILTDKLGAPGPNRTWSTLEGLKDGAPPLHLRLDSNWLFLADQPENIERLASSLNYQSPGWSARPSFRKVTRNLDETADFLLYVDTPVLFPTIGPKMSATERQFANMIGPVGYSGLAYDYSQVRLDVFVGINPPAGSQLESFFASTAGQKPQLESMTAFNLPWDVANGFAIDYGCAKELLDAVIALSPEMSEQWDQAQDVVAGMMGIDAELGLAKLVEGRQLVSFERIDIFLNMFDAMLDMEASGPANDPLKDMLPRIPASFAFRVPSELNREAIVKKIRSFSGSMKPVKQIADVSIFRGERGLLSYAQDGEWLYVAGGRTERLIRNMLRAAKGRKQSLGSLGTWSQFGVRTNGRLLMYGHQKLDAYYSIMKGFILLLGAEFRPLAQEFGKIRDYHSAMTVVPDGFLMTGDIVHGDGR